MATKTLVTQYWQFENANGKWPWRWKHFDKANCRYLCIWVLEYRQLHSLWSDNVFGETNLLQRVCLVIHYIERYGMWWSRTWNGMECDEHLQIAMGIMTKRWDWK
jgi:hypothetical protein